MSSASILRDNSKINLCFNKCKSISLAKDIKEIVVMLECRPYKGGNKLREIVDRKRGKDRLDWRYCGS